MFVVVASGLACLAIAIVVAPERVREVCAKEGACELVSHVVLALALAGFAIATARARHGVARAESWRAVRPWSLALVTLACAVVLGEELDWGGVLGLGTLALALERSLGAANVHNAAHGHSYLVFAAAAPVLAAVALGRGEWARRWRARLGPWAPRPSDGAAALLVVAFALATALVQPAWDAEVDEIAELLGYTVIAGLVLRGHLAARGFTSSTYS